MPTNNAVNRSGEAGRMGNGRSFVAARLRLAFGLGRSQESLLPTAVTDPMTLDVKCDNFLRDNHHVYAIKATRKKIAIIRIQVTNRHSSDVRLILGSSKLTSGGRNYDAESPAVVFRKLSEFTWDFLLYPIIDFHPVTASIEAFFFLTGPLYNRRLRRQLGLLSNTEMLLPPGESRTALLAFRGVSKELERLTIPVRSGNDDEQQLQVGFNST